MTFVSRYVTYPEAIAIVIERTKTPEERRSPLVDALEENALKAEVRIKDEWTSLEKFDQSKVWFPFWNIITVPDEGKIFCDNIRILRSEIDHLWPDVQEGSFAQNRGRRPKDWDAFWIEVVLQANTIHGLSVEAGAQAALEKRMMSWAEHHMGKVAESTVRAKISPLYKALRARGQK